MVFKRLAYQQFTDIEEFKAYRKQKFMFYTTLCFLFAFIGFGISSLVIRKDYLMATIDFVSAFILFINLIFIRHDIKLASTIFFISLIIAQLFLIYTGGFFNYGIIWCLCLPTLVYFLKGKKSGIFYLVLNILLISLVIGLSLMGVIKKIYSLGEFFYIAVIYFFASLLTFFYADTMEKSENIIKNQLYNHSITGLPNYNKLKLDIIAYPKATLVLINIDNFKIINDCYGNKTGDFILMEITQRIEKLSIPLSRLYKLHSDEFALLIYKQRREHEIKELLYILENTLKKSYTAETHDILLDFTMGIVVNSNRPLVEAAMALHHAKLKKINYLVYNTSMDLSKTYECNIRKIKNIKNAINMDKILIYYQPIFNNSTYTVTIYECLVRLQDQYGNVVLPHHFLDITKKTKLYPMITQFLIKKTFEFFKGSEYDFTINLSVDDIYNQDVFYFILQNLKKYGVGRQVIFEITESEKIEDNETINKFITTVKKEGCRIAIDDFGAGYSNFVYLLNMDIDFIKIDGTLIRKLETNMDSQVIVETIVAFTKKLGIATIAEFVQSQAIFEKVKALGITYSQGFYIGRPATALNMVTAFSLNSKIG